jgi:ribonuclease HII
LSIQVPATADTPNDVKLKNPLAGEAPALPSQIELDLLAKGKAIIVGCDEVGRGALAGPVVAAAVVLDYTCIPDGIGDSKLIPREQREALAEEIRKCAVAYAVCRIEAREIERINILRASLRAMRLATMRLGVTADALLVDGLHVPPLKYVGGKRPLLRAIVGGDGSISCISAASIIAKVERDAIMREYHKRYRRYGFDTNVGYGTPVHYAGLEKHGVCPQHRRTFRPIRELLEPQLALGFALDEAQDDMAEA